MYLILFLTLLTQPRYWSPTSVISECYITLHGCTRQFSVCFPSREHQIASLLPPEQKTLQSILSQKFLGDQRPTGWSTEDVCVCSSTAYSAQWLHWSIFPPAVRKDSYSPYDTPRGCCLVLQFVSLKGVSGFFHSTPLKTDESEYLFTSLLAF